MSIYGDQLKNRISQDRKYRKKNERILGNSVHCNNREYSDALSSDSDAIREILRIADYLDVETPELLKEDETLEATVDHILGYSGTPKRRVRLTGDWWKDGDGVMLAVRKANGQPIALFPGSRKGFYYYDTEENRKKPVTSRNADQFEEDALCFYRPLPAEPVSKKEFIQFIIKNVRPRDIVLYVFVFVFLGAIVTIPTFAMQLAFSKIIPSKQAGLLISLFILLIVYSLVNYLLWSVQYVLTSRVQHRLDITIQNSIYYRVMHLPHTFFADKTSGGLGQRIAALNKIPEMMSEALFIINCVVMMIIIVVPIIYIAPQLALPAYASIAVMLLVIGISAPQEMKLIRGQLAAKEESGGMVLGMIQGVERLRISGSEERAYARWLRVYAREAGITFASRFPLVIRSELIVIVKMTGFLWAFYLSMKNELSVAQFAAFSSAFGAAMGYLYTIMYRSRSIAMLKPSLEMGMPILSAVPEYGKEKKQVRKLKGEICLSHVSFQYTDKDPWVVNDLSLSIRKGEYVALVGMSGCGKSTLTKLLLGFEIPQQGSISYDGIELSELDLQSLRRNIGTVLQDGKLFSGDIYSNITITSPGLSQEAAWKAAELAGIADDIRNMPMGMQTMISEGGGGISGGQKQRLMIARAFASNPGVLIFDEATSALDNLSQKVITDSMKTMKATRIVIAHRLSTIRECDRIIVLNQGKIIESGSYETLVEKKGFFADLVSRQQLDEE